MKVNLYIDPGKHGIGLSVFADRDLVGAIYISGQGGANHPLLEVVAPTQKWVATNVGSFDGVTIEKPKVYQTAHQKGDQRDIVDLAIVVGGLGQGLGRPLALVEPSMWKGQIPKEIHHQRAKEALTESELAVIVLPKVESLQHNVWDAVAMGLHFAGRIK